MWQANIQVGNLPIGLSMRADGSVVLFRLAAMGGLVDLDDTGEAWAFFWQDEIVIVNTDDKILEELSYNVAYPLDLYPGLKQWLKHQNLEYPQLATAPNFKEHHAPTTS